MSFQAGRGRDVGNERLTCEDGEGVSRTGVLGGDYARLGLEECQNIPSSVKRERHKFIGEGTKAAGRQPKGIMDF